MPALAGRCASCGCVPDLCVCREGTGGRAKAIARVSAAAVQAFRAAGGSSPRAVELLLDKAKDDPFLKDALLEPFLRQAAEEAISDVAGPRAAPYATPLPPPRSAPPPRRPPATRGLELVAFTTLRDLLGEEISPGVALRDATVPQVLDAASTAALQARAGAVRSRWLRLVADRVPDGQRVGQALAEDALQLLHRRAELDLAAVLQGLSRRLSTGERQLEERSR